MKFLVILAVFILVVSALYQKWRSIPPQTKQMWGMLFGLAGAVRQAKKQMREQGNAHPVNSGANPFERVAQPQASTTGSNLMRECVKCGLHVPENEGVRAQGQFYCCIEHAHNE